MQHAPAPVPVQHSPGQDRAGAVEPEAPVALLPVGSWPCSACEQPNDLARVTCGGCGAAFLAAVRDAPPTLVLPVVGDLLALTPVRRLGVAVVLVVALLLATALLGLLLA